MEYQNFQSIVISDFFMQQADRGFARSRLREWNNLVQYALLLYLGAWNKKRGGALRGLRINREILILRKPPIEVVLLLRQ